MMASCIMCAYYRAHKVGMCRHYAAPADVAITMLSGFCPFFVEVVQ